MFTHIYIYTSYMRVADRIGTPEAQPQKVRFISEYIYIYIYIYIFSYPRYKHIIVSLYLCIPLPQKVC